MANEIRIGQGVAILGTLVRAFNLSNVRVPDARKSPYESTVVQSGYKQPDPTRPGKLAGVSGGVPVFADVTLKGGFYTDPVTGNRVEFPDIIFDTVILTVNFSARIVKTEIQGRDGTVKEYIGEDDAKIQIQGVITGSNGVYPQNEVNLLNQWRKAPIEKAVVCGFLQNLGIDTLVVEDCDIPQMVGGYSYQQFTISCLSDKPVELVIE